MQRNLLSEAFDAIKRGHWRRWLHGLDDDFLHQIHVNFQNWRNKPEGKFGLNHAELDKRIAIIESVIASR